MTTPTTTTPTPTPERKIYRAYTGYKYNIRTEHFQSVDLYDLTLDRMPIDQQVINYYFKEHPNDKIPALSGTDNHVILLSRDSRFPGDYTVLPLQLRVRQYYNVRAVEIELLEEESKSEGIEMLGAIKGIAPIREMLELRGEELLCHEITVAAVEEEDVSAHERIDHYKPYPGIDNPNGKTICHRVGCPVCFGYGSLKIYPKWLPPQQLLLGGSIDHPWVQRINRLRKIGRIMEILSAIEPLPDLDINDDNQLN